MGLNTQHMHRITKRLLFILLTIMAYLPMTVVNAMPNVSIPAQTQSVITMDMAGMDMADCHHQTNKTCDHCSSQHATHCVHSACFVSLAITTHYSLLNINRNFKNSDKTLRINTQFQQTTPLLRPPISS
jgi:uncharacterized membrane protein